ncbi:hypothetical protein [Rhodococcus tibetensis]|uniref:Uncharacterized protein n=1 Tax=Rhodococcus tibetensis TaxID=2965064 RepID=A0ABT1QKF0_9NOCA|nr:hypothetical protein [Rhodococcus sp. FXJ9.536]MCQ4122765.1 hypothetical protein [Rhodococcus sp. FXJ9.536]
MEVTGTDLVPASSVVRLPSPRIPLALAAVLAIVAIVLAVVGLGEPALALPSAGAVSVAGADPAAAVPIVLDLTAPVAVTAAVPGFPDTATLAVGVLDVPVTSTDGPLVIENGIGVATLPPIGSQYLMAGELTGTLTLSQAGQPTQTWTFPVNTVQPATTTVGATVFAGVLGAAVVGGLWLLSDRPLDATTLTVCAVTAAAAGAAAVGAARIGRRRRSRRAHRGTRATEQQQQR